MRAREDVWRDALACPRCGGSLLPGTGADLVCDACGQAYPAQGDLLALLPPEQAEAFAASGCAYRAARLREGWRPLGAEQLLSLPACSSPGYPALYWPVRRQSYRALVRLLAAEGPAPADGPVADLGAGTGWLAYRLARMGYRVLAVDASTDGAFGLGAAGPFLARAEGRLLLAQGDLEQPPLRAGQWSIVILNASLHYARDLEATVCAVARALQRGGRTIIMDTPVARRPVAGTGRGDRHLGRQELAAALRSAGLRARWLRVWRDPRWWLHRAKAWLRCSGSFSFPLIVAEP